ncbi:MAG: hypothetical protein KBT39_05160, partial [Bacteroidales bacterium]|nr:hypothetical protein [Bacteroidales bacterium]
MGTPNVPTDQSLTQINKAEVMQMLNAAANQPTADEVEYKELYDKCLITTAKEYPAKEFLLEVKGVRTLTRGDLHMVQAQAKNGKTTLVTIMVAAILAGQWGPVAYALEREAKVIIFDTEQFECDTFHQYQMMMHYGNMPEECLDRLQVYNLRGMSYEERRRFVVQTLEREKPVLAVIDGIRDLVLDINDPVSCPQFVDEMMQLASKVYCSIIGVLHNNPNEGKARGWLGTEWINKCGYSYEPQKLGNVVTVKNTVFRGAPVPDWQFTFDRDGTPVFDEGYISYIRDKEAQQKQREAEEAKAARVKEHLDIVMGELKANNGLLSRADFVKHIVDMKIEGLGRQKVYDLIKAQIALPVP